MKKHELKDYVKEIIEKRKNEEYAKVSDLWDETVAPVVEKELDLLKRKHGEMDECLKKVTKTLEDYSKIFPFLMDDYSIDQLYSKIKLNQNLLDVRVEGIIMRELEKQAKKWGDTHYIIGKFPKKVRAELKNRISAFQITNKAYEDKKEQLRQLQKEALQVIDRAKGGKQGYKNLQILGFPMDDFVPAEEKPQLPAITEFSVDTCILTTTCEEPVNDDTELSTQ